MKLKFLIVENNKEEQKKIREILQKRGIGFKIFSNFKVLLMIYKREGCSIIQVSTPA